MWTDANPIKIFEYMHARVLHTMHGPTPTPNKSRKCIQSIILYRHVVLRNINVYDRWMYTYVRSFQKFDGIFYYNNTQEVNNLNNEQC